MYRALAFKELRETWWMGAIAFLILATHVYTCVGINIDIERFSMEWGIVRVRIPFVTDELAELLLPTASILGAVLGFWQAFGESFRGTWRFLRQRPMSFAAITLTKIATGLTLSLGATALPILLYALWAARPGNHASPFRWSLTVPIWQIWFVSSTAYLAAFLVGIRDVRWYGSRLWPVVPAVIWITVSFFLYSIPFLIPTLAINGVLLGAILSAASERDD
jgi:hypothetical protein